jgi:hypothetical protein
MLSQKLVHDFREELMCHERGVVVVRDDDASDAFGAAVGMEGIVFAFMVNVLYSE